MILLLERKTQRSKGATLSQEPVYNTPNGPVTKTQLEAVGVIGEPPDFFKPVLFLDNDGVINIDGIDRDKRPELMHEDIGIRDCSEFDAYNHSHVTVYWDPVIVNAVRNMNAIWTTSWRRMAVSKLNPVYGFDFPYLEWTYRGVSDYGQYGKAAAVGGVVRLTGCDWVVVDDDFTNYIDVLELECEKNGVVIVPNFELGITRNELSMLARVMSGKSPVIVNNTPHRLPHVNIEN